MSKRRLPIGVQTLRKICEGGYYYVDKTAYMRRMLEEGTHYFISRPRRFGKSLLLDTFRELFEGNEPLFRGLRIHDTWDWTVRHPVVWLSFGAGHFARPGAAEAKLVEQLAAAARRFGTETRYATVSGRFASLLEALHDKTGQRVVVLVDEYDKPILEVLDVPETARDNRDFLQDIYGVIKDSDGHVRFAFLAGVTNFSTASLFSGLNNLRDITLDPRYSAICGYTEVDLDRVFGPELPGFNRDEVRDWYAGYSWCGDESVYNPLDILLLFDRGRFGPWWFDTGTTRFPVETLLRRRVSSLALGNMVASDDLLSAFDLDDMATEALLFQTGYLTIRSEDDLDGEPLYSLRYPNRAVRQSLKRILQCYDLLSIRHCFGHAASV